MKGLLATILALLAFCATHAVIGRVADERPELRLLPDSIEAQKFAHFRAHAEDYDLVYVGTSRVFRGFDPATFDKGMAGLGHPLRSYNFGLVGLNFLEERYIVDWILAQRSRRLRWLLIEPIEGDLVLARANLFTLRDVNWHTPDATARGVRASWQSSRGRGERLELARAHLLHGLERACNVGVVAGLLARLFAPIAPYAPLPAGFEGRDTAPELEVAPAAAAASATPAARAPEPAATPLVWETYRELHARARAAGLEPLYVIPPTSMPLAVFKEARDRGDLEDLLIFPLRTLPEIAADQGAYFYDAGHLNARGAALFSRRLAQEFVAWLAAER